MDKKYIKGIISSIQETSRKAGLFPDYALMESVRQRVISDFTDTLRDMCRNGEIEYHRTINSVGFGVKGGNDDDTRRTD